MNGFQGHFLFAHSSFTIFNDHTMKTFFSCDWGTSAFRLRLVDAESGKVLFSVKTPYGISAAFNDWKQANQPEENRIAFYQAYLFDEVKKITASFNDSFDNVPLILSGMASSSIGMMELPYKELPFLCNGSDLIIHTLRGEDLPYKIIMISGAKSAVDVIRGEETILAGCHVHDKDNQQLFIFPGTHSKHITVQNGAAQSITSYMTGELFELLSKKSVLSASVKKNDPEQNLNNYHFVEGVNKGITLNLMNSIFHVRTNQLFKKLTPLENYHYLSGLLIGHELKDVAENNPGNITLVCSEGLKNEYIQALDTLGLGSRLYYENADHALVNGHLKIMQQPGKKT